MSNVRPDMRRHPSGRPIRPQVKRQQTAARCPYEGPLSPGLVRKQPKDAMGFVVYRENDDGTPR